MHPRYDLVSRSAFALMMSAGALCATAAYGSQKILPLTDLEPQYANKLCWAAVDVTVVNYFYPSCPTPSGATAPTSQVVEAANNELHYTQTNTLADWIMTCKQDIQNCNLYGLPALQGLTYDVNTDPNGLKFNIVKQEMDQGRPFLFIWDYPSNGSDNTPVGKHQLMAFGYNDDDPANPQLWIWDPWWVPNPPNPWPVMCPVCGGLGLPPGDTAVHARWIPFSLYVDPQSDMGIQAVHDADVHNLARFTPTRPRPPTNVVIESLILQRPCRACEREVLTPPRGVAFADAMRQRLTEVPPRLTQRRARGSVGTPPGRAGVPFPLVGLGLDQLRGARANPTALLSGTTHTLLYPIEANGVVVDAFLLLFRAGQWQEGGYANTVITDRLVSFRASYAQARHVRLDELYAVSVPGHETFFVAQGSGAQAVLIPIATDPTIGAVAGQPIRANVVLPRLVRAIDRDIATAGGRGNPVPGAPPARPPTPRSPTPRPPTPRPP